MSASGPRPRLGSHKFSGGAHLCLWGAAQPPLPFVTEQVTELAEQSDPRQEGLEGRADPPSTTTPRMGVCLVLLWMQLMCLLFFCAFSEGSDCSGLSKIRAKCALKSCKIKLFTM